MVCRVDRGAVDEDIDRLVGPRQASPRDGGPTTGRPDRDPDLAPDHSPSRHDRASRRLAAAAVAGDDVDRQPRGGQRLGHGPPDPGGPPGDECRPRVRDQARLHLPAARPLSILRRTGFTPRARWVRPGPGDHVRSAWLGAARPGGIDLERERARDRRRNASRPCALDLPDSNGLLVASLAFSPRMLRHHDPVNVEPEGLALCRVCTSGPRRPKRGSFSAHRPAGSRPPSATPCP